MEAIRKGRVHMRPRWHFLLLSALAIVGILILSFTLLYVSSLAVFLLRDSGAWFAPSLGARGWWVFVRSLPWILILLIVLFVVVLETLVRRYAFIYRKPLLTSVLGILALVFLGGFAIALTPLPRQMEDSARRGELPPPLNMMYGDPVRMPPPGDSYHGEIAAMMPGGFVIIDQDGDGTTTVLLTPRTRLPYGADFSVGERVIVIGDAVASGTVQAFGVQEIDQ